MTTIYPNAELQRLIPSSPTLSNDSFHDIPNNDTPTPSPVLIKDNNNINPNFFIGNRYTMTDFFKEISIGSVNTLICIPVLYGFTTIVYSHSFFEEIRPVLVKILMWSSILHQISMTIVSSMNYSVCQVQDAGLLFLGAMATKLTDSIISTCGAPQAALDNLEHGAMGGGGLIKSVPFEAYSFECTTQVISTTLFTIALATVFLGLALMFISRKGLASLVNFLPLSVISAYLAYIGALLFTAGISISADITVAVPHDIFAFFWYHYPKLIYILPQWFLALGLMWVQRKYPSPLTLPISLLAIPVIFYTFFFLLGFSLNDLRDMELISQPHTKTHSISNFIHITKVHYNLIPTVFVEWLLMVFVVAFSSALDIVSIELELGKPLDINRELWSVGFSNFINGFAGGATGSYIFSQTIFTAKSRPKSRLPGATLAAIEAIVLFLSVDLTAFLPKLWFATTLTYIGFELMYEWIIQRRKKVQMDDYCVTLVTFIAIICLSLQTGLFIGVLCALVHFICVYHNNFSINFSTFYTDFNDNIPSIVRPTIYYQPNSNNNNNNNNNNNGRNTNNGRNNNNFPIFSSTLSTTHNNNPIQRPTSCPSSEDDDMDSFGVNIRHYLTKNVAIFELEGHIRFMTATKILNVIREAISAYQAAQLKDYLIEFYHYNPSFIQYDSLKSSNDKTTSLYDPIADSIGSSVLAGDTSRDQVTTSNGESFYTPVQDTKSITKSLGTDSNSNNNNNTNNNNNNNYQKQSTIAGQYNTFGENRPWSGHSENSDLMFDDEIKSSSSSFPQFFTSAPNNHTNTHPRTPKSISTSILARHINPTFIIDFANVLGVDSSAIHNTKLILNSCNQLQNQQPNILEIYNTLKKTHPTFPYTLPPHLLDSQYPPIPLYPYDSSPDRSPMGSPFGGTGLYGNNNNYQNGEVIYQPTFTTTFDLLFTAVSNELLTLFIANGIALFDTTQELENERDVITELPSNMNTITLTNNNNKNNNIVAPINTPTNFITQTTLGRSSSSSSTRSTGSTITSSSMSPAIQTTSCYSVSELAHNVTAVHNHQTHSSPSSLVYTINSLSTNIALQQLEVVTLFNLDPHTTPSFVPPLSYNNLKQPLQGVVIDGQPFLTSSPHSQQLSTSSSMYPNSGVLSSTSSPALPSTPLPEQYDDDDHHDKLGVVFAHFEDQAAAKTWVAAKAYFLQGFKI